MPMNPLSAHFLTILDDTTSGGVAVLLLTSLSPLSTSNVDSVTSRCCDDIIVVWGLMMRLIGPYQWVLS